MKSNILKYVVTIYAFIGMFATTYLITMLFNNWLNVSKYGIATIFLVIFATLLIAGVNAQENYNKERYKKQLKDEIIKEYKERYNY